MMIAMMMMVLMMMMMMMFIKEMTITTTLLTTTLSYHTCIFIGLAYRLPDTNINLSGSYQQGKGNVQISCVPDEAMSLLGPNGTTMMMIGSGGGDVCRR